MVRAHLLTGGKREGLLQVLELTACLVVGAGAHGQDPGSNAQVDSDRYAYPPVYFRSYDAVDGAYYWH